MTERERKLEMVLRGLCERLDRWWYEADPECDLPGAIKKGDPHPWTVDARAVLAAPASTPETWPPPCAACVSEVGRVDPNCHCCHGTGICPSASPEAEGPRPERETVFPEFVPLVTGVTTVPLPACPKCSPGPRPEREPPHPHLGDRCSACGHIELVHWENRDEHAAGCNAIRPGWACTCDGFRPALPEGKP